MHSADDITNLFRQFGGDPADYHELSRENGAVQAGARWPRLASVGAVDSHPIAPVPPSLAAVPVPRPAESVLFAVSSQTIPHVPVPVAVAVEPRIAYAVAPTSVQPPGAPHGPAPGATDPAAPEEPLPLTTAVSAPALAPPTVSALLRTAPGAASVPSFLPTVRIANAAAESPAPVPTVANAGKARRDNNLVAVFQRLQSAGEPRRAGTPGPAASESLLRKLLRS